jgi:AhpD family alkylhydroperoxidase
MIVTEEHVNTLATKEYGLVPPLVKQMAAVSPGVAYHYLSGLSSVSQGRFSTIEQHSIQLKVSLLNQCESCIKGHSFLLKNLGMSEEDIASIRHGLLTSAININRVIALTEIMFDGGRNGFSDEHLIRIERAQAEKAELFEIVSLIASKTISNYINNYLASIKTKEKVTHEQNEK